MRIQALQHRVDQMLFILAYQSANGNGAEIHKLKNLEHTCVLLKEALKESLTQVDLEDLENRVKRLEKSFIDFQKKKFGYL